MFQNVWDRTSEAQAVLCSSLALAEQGKGIDRANKVIPLAFCLFVLVLSYIGSFSILTFQSFPYVFSEFSCVFPKPFPISFLGMDCYNLCSRLPDGENSNEAPVHIVWMR